MHVEALQTFSERLQLTVGCGFYKCSNQGVYLRISLFPSAIDCVLVNRHRCEGSEPLPLAESHWVFFAGNISKNFKIVATVS